MMEDMRMEQDLNRPATCGMLMEVESRLSSQIKQMATKSADQYGHLKEMEERLRTSLKADYERLYLVLTGYVDDVRTIDRREVITSDRVTRLEKRVDILEEKNNADN